MFSFNFLPMFFYVYRNNKNKNYRRLAVYGILFTVSRLFILIVWKFLIIDISTWYEYICLIIWISIYEDVAIWPDGSILEPWTLFPLYSLSLKTAIEYNDTRNWKRMNLKKRCFKVVFQRLGTFCDWKSIVNKQMVLELSVHFVNNCNCFK